MGDIFEPFEMKTRVKQTDASSLLFNYVLEKVIQECQ